MQYRSFVFGRLFFAFLSAVCAAAMGEFLINQLYFKQPVVFAGQWLALFGNILILFSFFAFLRALVNRRLLSLFIGLCIYGLLIAVDIIKLKTLDNPLLPADFQYLTDLRVVSKSLWNFRTIFAIVLIGSGIGASIRFLWKKESPSWSRGPRIWTGLTAGVLLILLFALPICDPVREWISERGIARPESWQFDPRVSAQLNGLLVEWAMSATNPGFHKPERYSRPEIERIARAYVQTDLPKPASNAEKPPNLIMFLIESFMDPIDLGVRYTFDPIPTFRELSRRQSSGKVVVPVFGGTSANTEFELLTGLSMYFLSDASCPYRQYIAMDIPSLPRFLHQHGYRTTAILADPPYLFNRKAVLGHLGFDGWRFPEEDPATPRTRDDEFASDEAIVDAVIALSRKSSPYFIHAFTGGTHYPWEYTDFKDSPLDIVGSMPEPQHSRLKTYVNALNEADKALKKLIAHFEKSDQRTVILIMGDHLPPLAEVYDTVGFFKGNSLSQIQKRYQAPAILWCNWPASKEDFVNSANAVPVRLLQFMGMHPAGSLALTADVCAHFPVLSQYVKTEDGRIFSPQDPNLPFQQLLDDYQLIEYDLLKGKQYALEMPGWGWSRR
jgi:phosphoglycerol transferase MdoB-like AlkP superfamily enzyme